MPRIRRLPGTLAVLLLASLGACDESSGPEGSVQVSLSQAGVILAQGATASSTIQISRGGGFAGPVTLAASGLPNGVVALITPNQLTGTTVNATIEVSAAFFAAPGVYFVTITASAEGIDPATTSMQLTVMAAPDFRISVSTPALTVNAGGSINTNVNIERTNFTGAIELALLNPPAGVTGTFTSVSSTTSTLTISAAPGVTPATYPLVVQGLAASLGSRTANLLLNVLPQPGAFTITTTPASFTLPRGNSAVVDIAITRTDYDGPIALAFENPPPGITGTIVPSNTTGNTATFTLNVGETVSAGIYQLRIKASAPGFIDRVAFVQVTVTIPMGGTVEYLYCDPSALPVFFAYQDGSGAWKAVSPTTVGTTSRYTFTLVQGRGGVLVVHRTSLPFVADASRNRRLQTSTLRKTRALASRTSPRVRQASVAAAVDIYETEVLYATAAELTQDGIENCRLTLATKSVTATVAGVTSPEIGIVSLGSATGVFIGGVTTNPLPLDGVPDGTLDLLASRMTAQGNPPNRIVVMRGLEVPDGGTVPATVDFAGPASSAPATATATIAGAGFDFLELFVTLSSTNSHGELWFDLAPTQNNVRPWGGLSNAVMLPGDLHGLTAFATPNTATPGEFRVTQRYVSAVADQNLSLGPVLNAPTATQVVGGTYPRYRFAGSVQAEYDKGVSLDILPRNTPGNGYSITATAAWLAGAGNALAYDFTMPDVTGLTGFPVASRLTPGVNDAAASGFGFTGPGIFDLRPTLGAEFKAASRSVTIPVP